MAFFKEIREEDTINEYKASVSTPLEKALDEKDIAKAKALINEIDKFDLLKILKKAIAYQKKDVIQFLVEAERAGDYVLTREDFKSILEGAVHTAFELHKPDFIPFLFHLKQRSAYVLDVSDWKGSFYFLFERFLKRTPSVLSKEDLKFIAEIVTLQQGDQYVYPDTEDQMKDLLLEPLLQTLIAKDYQGAKLILGLQRNTEYLVKMRV